jgi:precorrin-3B synthase
MNAAIRGACPGIVTPMTTGDGLLARLVPHEPISIRAFQTLCAAAAEYGNGVVEVTQRGSLQIRGLNDVSARDLAESVRTLGIGVDGGPPILTSPLFGFDADGLIDSSILATALRSALGNRMPVAAASPARFDCLCPKVSVLLDDGGKLHLDAIPADIRMRAVSASRYEIAIAGDASNAVELGYARYDEVIPTVLKLLDAIANRGVRARAKDLLSEPGILAALSLEPMQHRREPRGRPPVDSIGVHALKGGTVARGFGLAFGHTTATTLQQFTRAAEERGATSIRPAPGRALLAIGLASSDAVYDLDIIARSQSFIVDPSDPRRHVIACAGSPACASATLPTRQLAPEVANVVRRLVGTEQVVHLSGCSKGCAHPSPAAITIVGPDHWLLNGRASDAPHGTLSKTGLVAEVERLCTGLTHV